MKIEALVKNLLREIGENPEREGLVKTPLRVEKAWRFLTKGYAEDPRQVINGAIFEEENQEMVLVKDVDFFSLCEHHLLPFAGQCHLAYIPRKKIIGLSKLVRLVEVYSRRLQVQERLTQQIARTLQQELNPLGVGVVMEAQHFCMMMRGVEKQNSVAVTSSMQGAFRNRVTRWEFFNLLGRPTVRAAATISPCSGEDDSLVLDLQKAQA